MHLHKFVWGRRVCRIKSYIAWLIHSFLDRIELSWVHLSLILKEVLHNRIVLKVYRLAVALMLHTITFASVALGLYGCCRFEL